MPEEKKPAELVEEHTGPIVYRDGTGKILEDEDLVLHNTVINDMMDGSAGTSNMMTRAGAAM